MTVRIDLQALVKEHLTITALSATDKQNQVVARGKLRDIRHTVGHRTTDGIETLKMGVGGDMRLDIVDDTVVFIKRLGGL